MITGAHSIIYSREPDEDRAFLRNVLKLPCIDSGGGRLIFGLPPAEVAVHPSNRNYVEEFYLMCDDIDDLVRHMKEFRVKCTMISRQAWGLITGLRLPGRGTLKVYQPLHPRPKPMKTQQVKSTAQRAGANDQSALHRQEGHSWASSPFARRSIFFRNTPCRAPRGSSEEASVVGLDHRHGLCQQGPCRSL